MSGRRRNVRGVVDLDGRRLRKLGEERLIELLRRRPDAADPALKSLGQLAARLADPMSVVAALRRLDLPTLQVAEAIAALGGRTDRPALDRLLGAIDTEHLAGTTPVDRAIEALTGQALVLAEPDAQLWLAPAVRFAWASPLRLGPPLEVLVGALTADDLKFLCARLGRTAPARKAEAMTTLLAALRDEELVRSIVDKAPDEFREVLVRVAAGGVRVTEYAYYRTRDGDDRSPVRWAVSRGLLMRSADWANDFVMPAEVALALRGPDYTAPFDPVPPPCPRVAGDAGVVARDATAAAIDFLRVATSVLEEASRSRIPTLRTGGVGVRELKRLAKTNGATTDRLRLVLGTAHAAGLLTTLADGATPTPGYDGWLEAEPAERLAQLVRAWWSLSAMPTLAIAQAPAVGRAPTGVPDRPWVPTDTDARAIGLRAAATRLAAEGAPADWSAFADLVCWHHPHVRRGERAALVRAVQAWRDEAATLGVLGAGQLSEAGRALLAHRSADHGADDGADRALVDAFAGVGSVVRTAHLQADLTAVVTGTPAAALSTVLDAMADRESVAAASTWRFSPASIRGALDAGHTAEALLADLADIAAGAVPQTLEYLIRDVARRHGTIRASAVACCLRSDDTALLAEAAADRRLRALAPRLLAPTVLASQKPLPETLAALRKAGYAPVEEGPDGLPVLREAVVRRAVGVRRTSPRLAAAPEPGPADLRRLVAALVARPDEPEPAQMPLDPELLWQYQLDAPVTPPTRDVDYRPPWQPRRRW
jgi:Helicase conserved C-terminal domain